MRILRRLAAGLGHAFAAADDPRPPESLPLARQAELQRRLREALTENVAHRQRLTKAICELGARRAALYTEARDALRQGREELASLLLRQRYAAAQEEKQLRAQDAELAIDHRRLLLTEQQLAEQLRVLYTRWETTAARRAAADAQLQVSENASEISLEFTALASSLARAQEHTVELQAHSDALNDVAATGTQPNGGLPGSQEVEGEAGDSVAVTEITADLAKLKQEIAGAAIPSASTRPTNEEQTGA